MRSKMLWIPVGLFYADIIDFPLQRQYVFLDHARPLSFSALPLPLVFPKHKGIVLTALFLSVNLMVPTHHTLPNVIEAGTLRK